MAFSPHSIDLAGKTRAARFRVLRDALLERSDGIREADGTAKQDLYCGPFWIMFCRPGVFHRTKFSMQIWPGGHEEHGHIMHLNKVANVSWDARGDVEIVSYRSGPWEDDLLRLLRGDDNLVRGTPAAQDLG